MNNDRVAPRTYNIITRPTKFSHKDIDWQYKVPWQGSVGPTYVTMLCSLKLSGQPTVIRHNVFFYLIKIIPCWDVATSLAAEDISARFAICFICCRPSCVQPTAVAWCVRVIRRSSRGVCGSFDDRRLYRRRSSSLQRADKNRMVCA